MGLIIECCFVFVCVVVWLVVAVVCLFFATNSSLRAPHRSNIHFILFSPSCETTLSVYPHLFCFSLPPRFCSFFFPPPNPYITMLFATTHYLLSFHPLITKQTHTKREDNDNYCRCFFQYENVLKNSYKIFIIIITSPLQQHVSL